MKNIPFYKRLPNKELKEGVNYYKLKSSNDYDVSVPHRHGYFEIFFFKQGNGTHIIDFETISIDDLSIHVITPGQVHQLGLLPVSEGCFITFSEFYLRKFLTERVIRSFSFLNSFGSPSTLTISKKEFLEYEGFTNNLSQGPNDSLEFAWLNLILQKLKADFESHFDFHLKSAQDETLIHFKQILEQTFTQEHSPSYYAQQIGVTEKQLNANLKATFGITATETIAQRVLLEAKRLLLHSSLSIKEIAFDLGFNDPAYFSRFIKKHTTKSPKELRDEI